MELDLLQHTIVRDLESAPDREVTRRVFLMRFTHSFSGNEALMKYLETDGSPAFHFHKAIRRTRRMHMVHMVGLKAEHQTNDNWDFML